MNKRDYHVVLIIDDDEDYRSLFVATLETSAGVRVLQAHRVYDGIGMIVGEGPVDFVLIDKNFGLMNGRSIKAEEFLKDQKIEFVYLTGGISVRELEKITSRGCEVWHKQTPLPELQKMITGRLKNIERTHSF